MASGARDQSDGDEELKNPVEEWERTDPRPSLCETLGASEDALGVATVEWLMVDAELGRAGDMSLVSSEEEEGEKTSIMVGRWAFHVGEPIWVGLEVVNGSRRVVPGVVGYNVDKLELLLWLELLPRLSWGSLFTDSELSDLEALEEAEERRVWKARCKLRKGDEVGKIGVWRREKFLREVEDVGTGTVDSASGLEY